MCGGARTMHAWGVMCNACMRGACAMCMWGVTHNACVEGACAMQVWGVSLLLSRLHRGVSLQLISLCGGVSLQLISLCGGVSLKLVRLVNANDLIGCGGDSSQMRFMHGCVWRGVHHWFSLVTTGCCP